MYVKDQWHNKKEEPQSLWSINIKFGRSQWQNKGERIRIWEKKIKKNKVQ
jgi:hypothetical protein